MQMPPSGSSGGVVKWLVIGCLGCSGLLVLGFIALLAIGALSSNEGNDARPAVASSSNPGPSDAGGASSSPDESEEAAAEETQAASTPSGMTGGTDESTITVTSTERTQTLRDSMWESTTSNEYFVINLDYTNKSPESHDLWASDFILVGADGEEYSSNTDAALAVEDPIIIDEVNPGLTLSGTLVFEVPPGTEFSELRLEESFGTSTSLAIPFD